jgi:hypothetical protein
VVTRPGTRAAVELGLACAALLGCAVSWSQMRSEVPVAPIAEGEPVITTMRYAPQLLLLTLLLPASAGVLAVVGSARIYRAWRERSAAAIIP